MNLDVKEKQSLLMMNILKERALTTLRYMNTELQKLELRNDIQSKVRVDLDQQQREYFLHQQMQCLCVLALHINLHGIEKLMQFVNRQTHQIMQT